MKKTLSVLALALLAAASLAAVKPDEARTIDVSGDAEVRVAPDQAVLSFGVESWSLDLAKARQDNDARMARILALPETFGVPKKNVQTDFLSVEPVYETNAVSNIQSIKSYRVRKNVTLVLDDLSKLDALVTAVLNAGANRFDGIEFRSTELRKYRDQARSLAVKAAREKAAAMASDLGQALGRPLSLSEQGADYATPRLYAQNAMASFDGGSSGGSTIAVGQIVIRAQVSARFELIDS